MHLELLLIRNKLGQVKLVNDNGDDARGDYLDNLDTGESSTMESVDTILMSLKKLATAFPNHVDDVDIFFTVDGNQKYQRDVMILLKSKHIAFSDNPRC